MAVVIVVRSDQVACGQLNNPWLRSNAMNRQIQYHAPLEHNSEVAWALWALIKFKCRSLDSTAKILSNLDDPIAALLPLDALTRRLTPSTLSLAKWSSNMTKQDLHGRNWILSYDGNVKGWLPSASVPDHIDDEQNFSLLKKWEVSFYNPNKAHDFTPIKPTKLFKIFCSDSFLLLPGQDKLAPSATTWAVG